MGDIVSKNFIYNSAIFLEALQSQVEIALEQCGMVAEAYAKKSCPVDTGALRNSITHSVDSGEKTAYVGTNMEYAPYVELGTGIHASGGRQTPWMYQDDAGKWHTTKGQAAREFIKPAAADHAEEYKRIIIATLSGE